MTEIKTCATCKASRFPRNAQGVPDLSSKIRECRAHPKQVTVLMIINDKGQPGIQSLSDFPTVKPDEDCEEWRPK
jgi:hypothetical protein